MTPLGVPVLPLENTTVARLSGVWPRDMYCRCNQRLGRSRAMRKARTFWPRLDWGKISSEVDHVRTIVQDWLCAQTAGM